MSPRKQGKGNESAPVKNGMWAFIYPHFDPWYLSGTFTNIEGRFTKEGKYNKPLYKTFHVQGKVFTRMNNIGVPWNDDWNIVDSKDLFKYLNKVYARDVAMARSLYAPAVYSSFERKRKYNKIEMDKMTPEKRKIAFSVGANPYKGNGVGTDHYEIFIPSPKDRRFDTKVSG